MPFCIPFDDLLRRSLASTQKNTHLIPTSESRPEGQHRLKLHGFSFLPYSSAAFRISSRISSARLSGETTFTMFACPTAHCFMAIALTFSRVRTEAYEPLTMEDIGGFAAMDLDSLGADRLEDLLDRAEDLLDELEDDEPGGGDSEEHDLRKDRLSETEDFIGRIRDRLDEPEEDYDD